MASAYTEPAWVFASARSDIQSQLGEAPRIPLSVSTLRISPT